MLKEPDSIIVVHPAGEEHTTRQATCGVAVYSDRQAGPPYPPTPLVGVGMVVVSVSWTAHGAAVYISPDLLNLLRIVAFGIFASSLFPGGRHCLVINIISIVTLALNIKTMKQNLKHDYQ